MQGVEAPQDGLETEKTALLRTYLYTPGTLYVTPTVVDECARIRSVKRRELHETYLSVLIAEWQMEDQGQVEERAQRLGQAHGGKADCRIFVEAEHAEFRALLTYDSKFLNRLCNVESCVLLARPSEYRERLAIPHGAKPDKVPHRTNPLAAETWWRW